MSVTLNPYLAFGNETKEAMVYYKGIFGGKLTMMTFKQLNCSRDPSDDDKIMHASLEGDHGICFMASDSPKGMELATNGQMSLSGDNHKLLHSWFNKLAKDGKVTMPLQVSAWHDEFGMLTDKFGVKWLVNIAAKPDANVAKENGSPKKTEDCCPEEGDYCAKEKNCCPSPSKAARPVSPKKRKTENK